MPVPVKILTLKEVAEYFKINEDSARELAENGKIPGIKIGGEWRFRSDYIESWLEAEMMNGFSGSLDLLETNKENTEIFIHSLIPENCIDLSLESKSKNDVLVELVNVAEHSDLVSNRRKLIFSLLERENLCSTGLTKGLAIPHPRFRMKDIVKKPFIVIGRSDEGIDFEALDGQPTYLFFLICLRFDELHVKIMARLSRLLRDTAFVENLRNAETDEEIIRIIKNSEEKLLTNSGN